MGGVEETVRNRLLALRDVRFRDFQLGLLPTVDPQTVIGVRMPELRKLAGRFSEAEATEFLTALPHEYFEENALHGLLIGKIGDYGRAVAALADFLPYVDNWATCDLLSPKVFRGHPMELFGEIKGWLKSVRPYTVRFGIGMLMRHYLDGSFRPEVLELAAGVKSKEYYVNMMTAWFFATALAKQYDAALPYLRQRRLDRWTHNKTIQKAIESYRISDEKKVYLRTLKIK